MNTNPGRACRAWRKSTYSNGGDANCVEVADVIPAAVVPVRDSKDPHGPVLCFPAVAWSSFIATVKGDLWTGGRSSRR
ncbi:DUF397 domain-containing protein [Streptomyces lydicus]|uniref:DUF397 domain-containing protein n=1 Tax=Streptomyces lydicus TaxID=47763 RepID=UPI00098183EA|nr:DUF397 domain-containing protein [Streptomyces lydicus]UEG92494.1 DUF397 domain-containing protein [Streptomyces lydicus]